MELRQLRYFAAVAAHGSFNRAARELHLTQPAVSRQVQNLEEELGTVLLRRTHNTVTLTAVGEEFYEEARDLLGRADQAVRRVRAQASSATLRISYVASLVARILPRAIQRFQANSPRVRLEFFESTPQEIGKRARSGGLDMAILPQGLEGCLPDFQWTELRRLSPVLVMLRDHPLAKLAAIDPAALRGQPLHGLGQTDFPEYAPRLRAILKPFGVKPRLASQSADGVATLFATLEASEGLTVLNDSILDTLPAALVGRPFSRRWPRRWWCWGCRRRSQTRTRRRSHNCCTKKRASLHPPHRPTAVAPVSARQRREPEVFGLVRRPPGVVRETQSFESETLSSTERTLVNFGDRTIQASSSGR